MIGPKCIHCKKQRYHHNGRTLACPIGKRHRILGFTQYSKEHRFEAKEKSTGGSSESRKDRKVRREVKSGPCAACGTMGTDWNPVDPAHIRTFKVSQSDHPANMIPLCRSCHHTQHVDGWSTFLENNPSVMKLLESMGWEIVWHPMDMDKLLFTHPEVK